MEILSERTVAKKFPYTNSQIVHSILKLKYYEMIN